MSGGGGGGGGIVYMSAASRGVTHLCAIQDRARGYIGIGPRGVTHLWAAPVVNAHLCLHSESDQIGS